MRNIEIDEDLYQYIASKTEIIGESASDILRRLLEFKQAELNTEPAAAEESTIEDSSVIANANHTASEKADETAEYESPNDEANKLAIDAHLTLPRKRRSKKKPTTDRVRSASKTLPPAESSVTPLSIEKVEAFLEKLKQSEELQQCGSSAKRFLHVLGMLSQQHNDDFAVVEYVQGAERLYFAREQSELEAAGSSTNPRQIPHSDYWVVTNSNTDRKRSMLGKVCKLLGYTETHITRISALI